MIDRHREWLVAGGLGTILLGSISTRPASAQGATPVRTRIVLLGTGTPGADPDRSGAATAIIVDDTPYLVDFGPGT